jgi:hypothetical protein
MYNIIIQSKYKDVFMVGIACVLVFVFMNSTSIVEGARNKKKDKKNDNKKNDNKKNDNKKNDNKKNDNKNNNKTDKKEVRKVVKEILPKMLKPPIEEIKKQQKQISSNLRGLSTRYKEFNKQIANVNTDIDKKIQEYNYKISSLYKSTEENLNGQYNMYKTGLSNDATVVANLIKQTDSNNSNLSEKITNTKNETKQYADDTKRIYEDVFGASTAKVIKQNNSEFKATEGFETKDYTGYATPNSNNKNLFHLENNLIQELNTFNTIYYSYVQCYSKGTCDVGNRKTISDVTTQADIVNAAITNLKNEYDRQNISTKDNIFENNHNEILNDSKSVDELRRSLDTKMDQILQNKKSSVEAQQHDSAVYAGIIWSILAISILFYIITEM